MPERIPDEKRREIIRAMTLSGNASAVARGFGVAEATVRNLMSEVRTGKYPEVLPFLEHLDVIRRVNGDLKAAGITVQAAADGLTIYGALEELGINLSELPNVVKILQAAAGDKPPPEFGNAVSELVRMRAETGLTFHDLKASVVSTREELERTQSHMKSEKEEVANIEARETQAKEELGQALKLNGTTLPQLAEYATYKATLTEAAIPMNDTKTLASFIRLAKSEGVMDTAKELHQLERETGMSFTTIRNEFKLTQERLEKMLQDDRNLSEVINAKNQKIADLKKEEAELLSNNGVTKERLDRSLSLVDRLKKAGIDLED